MSKTILPPTDGRMKMSEIKHTPGPWKLHWHGGIGPNENTSVCKADGASRSEREANAKLIAAAPEMLAALHTVRTALGIRDDFVPLGLVGIAQLIDPIIRKAEGK